eukprot:COSAG02_NODE_55_length_43887_cov_30.660364_36_plen_81_part_00
MVGDALLWVEAVRSDKPSSSLVSMVDQYMRAEASAACTAGVNARRHRRARPRAMPGERLPQNSSRTVRKTQPSADTTSSF